MTREGILKHKVMFDKWVSGEWIQFYSADRGWVDVDDPEFNESLDVDRFRVKQANTMTDMKELWIAEFDRLYDEALDDGKTNEEAAQWAEANAQDAVHDMLACMGDEARMRAKDHEA